MGKLQLYIALKVEGIHVGHPMGPIHLPGTPWLYATQIDISGLLPFPGFQTSELTTARWKRDGMRSFAPHPRCPSVADCHATVSNGDVPRLEIHGTLGMKQKGAAKKTGQARNGETEERRFGIFSPQGETIFGSKEQ